MCCVAFAKVQKLKRLLIRTFNETMNDGFCGADLIWYTTHVLFLLQLHNKQ